MSKWPSAQCGGRFSPAGQSFLWTLSLAFINVGLTTVPQQAQQQCQFPASWQGTWYHSGFPHPLNISTNHISSKGTCLQQSGSMFIMADRHNCQKCMVIHEKHPNVLQYKESYCHSSSVSASLENLCMSIESDSPLFFIFRTTSRDKNVLLQKDTEACPFRNIEYAFSYSTRGGAKVCQDPASTLDTCIEEEKMVFQFQACPDVPGSERADEVLECVATWKEGSSRYLVGRTMPGSSNKQGQLSQQQQQSSNYQCFRYERHYSEEKGGIVVKMAQSYSGACEGLWSAEEGDRTYTLWTVPTEFRECGLPEWIANRPQWTSLDSRLSLQMAQESSRRFKLIYKAKKKAKSTFSQMTCKKIVDGLGPDEKIVKLVAYQKHGCFSGFICLQMSFLHENVIHMRMGNRSRSEDEACRHHFFNGNERPIYLLANGNSIDCPFHGKFVEKATNSHLRHSSKTYGYSSSAKPSRKRCQNWIQSGCPLSTDMLIHLCGISPSRQQAMRDVTCIGTWKLAEEKREVETSTLVSAYRPTTELSSSKSLSTIMNIQKNVSNSSNTSSTSGILALRDQKGFGECLEYRESSSGILQITPGFCGNSIRKTKQIQTRSKNSNKKASRLDQKTREVTLAFQGSCQEALMDAHAVSLGITLSSLKIADNLFYDSMLTVMTILAILINV